MAAVTSCENAPSTNLVPRVLSLLLEVVKGPWEQGCPSTGVMSRNRLKRIHWHLFMVLLVNFISNVSNQSLSVVYSFSNKYWL